MSYLDLAPSNVSRTQVFEADLGSIAVRLVLSEREPARLDSVRPRGGDWIRFGSRQPLVEVNCVGHGRKRNNTRFTHSGLGSSLRSVDEPWSDENGDWHTLIIVQRNDEGLEARTELSAHSQVAALEAQTTFTNQSDQALQLTFAASLSFGFGLGNGQSQEDLVSIEGYSEQLGENRWVVEPVWRNSGLVDFNSSENRDQPGRGSIRASGHSTWSTSAKLPTAGLLNRGNDHCVMWQVESNTGWVWEIDDDTSAQDSLSVVLSGPTDLLHSALVRLEPGASHVTKKASLAFSDKGFDRAIRELTEHRRAVRYRVSDRWDRSSVVFNDYMNTINGDPSTDRLLPLIDAASDLGADTFCVDAGWYDDTFSDWWPTVGEWQPSPRRFPGGIEEVFEHIRNLDMRLGLWLEPESVGVESVTAQTLSDDYFMLRGGQRISEHQRYFLDFRQQVVRDRMWNIFTDLIQNKGVSYFKLDYNVTPGIGFDAPDLSLGQALRESGEAYLSFIDELRGHHPHVTFESCSSGAMRADPETLRHFDLQSTSDQEDFLLYPVIAAGAPMSMVPEQAGNWAYIQPWMDERQMLFTLLTGMAGRLYLSGFVSQFSDVQSDLARQVVRTYRQINPDLIKSSPRWPVGFPLWTDPLVVYSRVSDRSEYLYVWKRNDACSSGVEVEPFRPVSQARSMLPGSDERWKFSITDSGTISIDIPKEKGVDCLLLKLS